MSGAITWIIWKARSKLVFSRDDFVPSSCLGWYLIVACYPKLEVSRVVSPKPHMYKQVLIGWDFPPHGRVKFNVDGSVRFDDRLAACGRMCRDEVSAWLVGFCRNLRSSSVLSYEF